jgi:hypothetical protein
MSQRVTTFKEIERDISAGSLEKALNRLIEFSESLVSEPRIVASVFGSRRLDGFCQTIGAISLRSFANDLNQTKESGSTIAIVVTEVYRSGGHTAVIKDLIAAYQNKGVEAIVLVVDTFQTANQVEISSVLAGTPIIFAPKELGAFERVGWLQKQILAIRPKRTFLFNHMQDAVAIAAAQPELPTKTSFFHQSDHRFSLGVFLQHVQHLDFRESGLENCRYDLGLSNNWLLPLTNPDLSDRSSSREFYSSGTLRTCTTGSYKFDYPYAFSLSEDVIPDIIAATGGSHLHIGPLADKSLSVIRTRLRERKIPQERFIVIDLVKSLWRALADFEVDVYIDSFPVCGCRSVVEVMGAGVPVVVHENYKSRLLSNKDLVYKEAFCWREPEELYRYLVKLGNDQLKRQSYLARQQYELKHSPSVFAEAVEALDTLSEAPAVSRLPAITHKDECLEYFEYSNKDRAKTKLKPERTSTREITAESLVGALKAIVAATSKEDLDKTQLSKVLFASATNGAERRSNLSEALLQAARIAYPDGASTVIDKETISEFLFRFSISLRDTDFDISALHKLPMDVVSHVGKVMSRP